jgi:1,2-diacylglycerol 3-alpha-glucosyltransferase
LTKSNLSSDLRVYLICTGVGIMNRGIETFFRECFDGLHPFAKNAGIDLKLFRGNPTPPTAEDEYRVWCLPRTSRSARLLASLSRRTVYGMEQVTALPGMIRAIRRGKPSVILFSDQDLARWLLRLRTRIGVPFQMIFSNGAPAHPPYSRCCHVQQVAPFYYDEGTAAGWTPELQTLVPYGINVPEGPIQFDNDKRQNIRRQLSLPLDRQIVLCVGWIAAYHKRMDYVINEISKIPSKPYLVMLGAMDEHSPPILKQAREVLGDANFTARSVPYEQVGLYYQAADAFTLGSLKEGFGRVYLEALMHGLPCAVNDYPVMRWVLGEEGTFADFTQPQALASLLTQLLAEPLNSQDMTRRRESVRKRFSWEALAPDYFAMFRKVAAQPLNQP